ncbi:MAG: hypothetical protein IAF58_21380 [Leptolyngbya sp.]|nr:hypothetical protein [Candidatus Melainabacteria bacterium]
MTALFAGILVFVLIVGITVMLIFSSNSRGKNAADELALTSAQVLNHEDRQGRINTLTERSRELVYSSRNTYAELSRNVHHLEPLSRQMMEEARNGANLVGQERSAIIVDMSNQIDAELKEENRRLLQRNTMNLGWFRTDAPLITGCEIGTIKNVDSNVLAPPGFDELRTYDIKTNLINTQSNLYKAGVDLKLPSPDSDLKFNLSSLPAPVKGTIAGARLLADDRFVPEAKMNLGSKKISFGDNMPSAVRLKISTQVTASGQGQMSGNVANSSVATTNGGTPAPDEEQ